MPKIEYVHKKFREPSLQLIAIANSIIHEYGLQGFSLTLRQLYYQMVARDIIANRQSEYKKLGSIVTDARLAGLIDWHSIEDRTRALRGSPHWNSPAEIMQGVVSQYKIDKWATQPQRVEVWIEKDALVGVIEGVCREYDIDYFSCRGYASASEMWKAGRRLQGYLDAGQEALILHFGDHDPSGMDMTRDIWKRLEMFAECSVYVKRMALNMDQIEKYDPPPNPTKLTDSRAQGYIRVHGYNSWELDALEPKVFAELISGEVEAVRDNLLWGKALDKEAAHVDMLGDVMEAMEVAE